MLKRSMCLMVALVLAGCGTMPEPVVGPQGVTGPQGPQGPQGVQGPQGPQGEGSLAGDSSVLSWAHFNGLPPTNILVSGGPVEISSLLRVSEGIYHIEYDVLTDDVGVVGIFAGGYGMELEEGENIVIVLGTAQLTDRTYLTIEVVSVASILDGVRLIDFDTLFSLTIFGNLP